ncbi:MAG: ATP-binding protein [Bacteroidota bacterium]
MKRKFKDAASVSLASLKPHWKAVVAGVGVLITIASILYTNNLVEQLREGESRQIKIYASSLEFLANESESNFILIFDQIVRANHTIPVILTDQSGNPEDYKNLSKADAMEDEEEKKRYLLAEVAEMKLQREPISITLKDQQNNIYGYKYIYYKNSFLLNELRFYPYIQLSVIAIFGMITFMVINSLKKAEQNRVWVGMAKETAHQLGTPLSSLMAWSEYFKELYPERVEELIEFDKDVDRLKIITDRFSSIGSEPQLEEHNLTEAIEEIVSYLQKRISKKITFSIASYPNSNLKSWINPSLFAWVIENLCKNAVDAMDGKGSIAIQIIRTNGGQIAIDVEDTGRGIAKSKLNDVFQPGFTTKKRGWGLGLALAKRIIEEYHKGKIFVKESEVQKGTTFRIYLRE